MSAVAQMVRSSIVFFFTLAVFFFVMIFLLSAAFGHKEQNEISDKTPIQQNEVSTWGYIPGELNYASNQTLNLYNFNYEITSTASEIDMTVSSPYYLNGMRNFTNVTWNPQKSVVDYLIDNQINITLQDPNIPSDHPADETTTYLYPNLAAIDTWTQMTDKPRFQLAWEAINQATSILFNADILNRFYAYNADLYMFQDYDLVTEFVLIGLTADEQLTVYQDQNFGMNTVKGLTWWVSAASGGGTSDDPYYTRLVNYYMTKYSIDLTNGGAEVNTMTYAVGPKSMLAMVTNVLSQQIRTDPNLYQTTGSINIFEIAQYQWGDCAVVYDNMMKGLPETYSFASMDEVFKYPPEFGAYVMNPEKGGGTQADAFSASQAKILIARDPASYQTFLNIQNMQYYYETYAVGEYDALITRFGFTNEAQVQMFNTYIEELVDQFLNQNSTTEIVQMGTLLNKQMNATYGWLGRTLPLQLAARVVAANAATTNYGQRTASEYYLNNAGVSSEAITANSTMVDFTNSSSVLYFINSTWYDAGWVDTDEALGIYPSEYQQWLMDTFGFTQTIYEKFYATTSTLFNRNPFGIFLKTALQDVADYYQCANGPTNCTEIDLGAIQWGNSYVTLNHKTEWDAFFTNQDTVMGWGTEEPFVSMLSSPEYKFWTQDESQGTLDNELAGKLCSSTADFYGLSDKTISQILTVAVYEQDTAYLAQFSEWYGSGFDLQNFLESARIDIQTRFFGNMYASYTADQMINGFENPSAALLNGGDYYNGDNFNLRSWTTPIFHDTAGILNQTVYGMYTGANNADYIGFLRLINGVADINKLEKVWTGTEDTYFTIKRPYNATAGETVATYSLDDVSYGMQFPPNMDQGKIKAFNERTINIEEFQYDSEMKLDGTELTLYKYTTPYWPGSLQYSVSLPTTEKPFGCYGCERLTSETRTLKVNGTVAVPSTTPAENYLVVQPDTGYTYDRSIQSSVYMLIGNEQQLQTNYNMIPTPFPTMDPIYGIAVPLYDLQVQVKADDTIFAAKFDYVSDTNSTTRAIVISFSVLAVLFLILGIVALVFTKMTGTTRSNSRDELLENHSGDLDDQD